MEIAGEPVVWVLSIGQLKQEQYADFIWVGIDSHRSLVLQRHPAEGTVCVGYPTIKGQIMFPIFSDGEQLPLGHMFEYADNLVIQFANHGITIFRCDGQTFEPECFDLELL